MTRSETLARDSEATLPWAALGQRFTVWSQRNGVVRAARALAPFAASAVGLWLCVKFCSGLDWHAVLQDLRRVGVGAPLLLLAPLVGNFAHMIGWRELLPVAVRPSLGRTLAISLAAQSGNELGLGVLGESLKVSELPREHRAIAWRAMLLDNLTALLALLAVIASIALFLAGFTTQRATSRLVVLGASVTFIVALLVGLSWWARRSQGAARGVLFAFTAHYAGKLWIVAEFALVLALLGSVSLRSSALLGLVSTLASAAGAAIPGQLGVLEAALKGAASACGLGACTLVSVALLRRLRSLLWVVFGVLLFWQLRAQRRVTSGALEL
jgi:hypothetical protein